MDIQKLERSNITESYFDPRFQQIIEDHLTLLKNTAKKQPSQIDSQKAYMFIGDFYGFLAAMNVPTNMHYAALRMNGYENPSDYDGGLTILYLPDPDRMALLNDIYKTRVNR